MNRWQLTYCKEYYKGKEPKSKRGQEDLALLGQVQDIVIVEFPGRNNAGNLTPPRTEILIVTDYDCNIPGGVISVSVLVSNLNLWLSRGYKVTTKKTDSDNEEEIRYER